MKYTTSFKSLLDSFSVGRVRAHNDAKTVGLTGIFAEILKELDNISAIVAVLKALNACRTPTWGDFESGTNDERQKILVVKDGNKSELKPMGESVLPVGPDNHRYHVIQIGRTCSMLVAITVYGSIPTVADRRIRR